MVCHVLDPGKVGLAAAAFVPGSRPLKLFGLKVCKVCKVTEFHIGCSG